MQEGEKYKKTRAFKKPKSKFEPRSLAKHLDQVWKKDSLQLGNVSFDVAKAHIQQEYGSSFSILRELPKLSVQLSLNIFCYSKLPKCGEELDLNLINSVGEYLTGKGYIERIDIHTNLVGNTTLADLEIVFTTPPLVSCKKL